MCINISVFQFLYGFSILTSSHGYIKNDGLWVSIVNRAMLVPVEYRITDPTKNRTAKDMRVESFHGFKRKDLLKFLESQIKNQNLENANYWCAECVMSGYVVEVYERLLDTFCNHVNIKNPLLMVSLWDEYDRFTELVNSYENLIDTRNDQEIRNILCSLASTLSLSSQFTIPKLCKISAMDLTTFPRLRTNFSNYTDLLTPFIQSGDAKELYGPLNEVVNHLRTPRPNSFDQVLYWLSWIVAWEQEYIKRYDLGACAERVNEKVEKVYYKDVAWILWDIVKAEGDSRDSRDSRLIIDKAYRFYVYHYSRKNRYKKITLLTFCLLLLLKSENVVRMSSVYCSTDMYRKVILAGANCNSLYRHIGASLKSA